uniref:DUF4806 domain-containing protein n=1 Tax=Anopheles atroparvus TaxID=41427 RepID=A0A182IRQ7_ANOAO
MVKSVFPFPVSKEYTVASKTYNMPVLICFQCSTVIRNFYNFSKQVEAIQTKLKKECFSRDGSLPIDQLVQYIKEEPRLHEDVDLEGTKEFLLMSADVEAPECESETSSNLKHTSEEHRMEPFELHNHAEGQQKISSHPIGCVDKTEVVNSIVSVEKRVNKVAQKLEILLQASLNNCKRTKTPFEFDLINNEAEFKAFDKAEREYMSTYVNWLTVNSTSTESAKRMKDAADSLFNRAFLTKCTWTGNGAGDRNVPLRNYKNVIRLFRMVGSTEMECVNERMVARFWQSKTKSVYSKLPQSSQRWKNVERIDQLSSPVFTKVEKR